jgi:hypothetical protein
VYRIPKIAIATLIAFLASLMKSIKTQLFDEFPDSLYKAQKAFGINTTIR